MDQNNYSWTDWIIPQFFLGIAYALGVAVSVFLFKVIERIFKAIRQQCCGGQLEDRDPENHHRRREDHERVKYSRVRSKQDSDRQNIKENEENVEETEILIEEIEGGEEEKVVIDNGRLAN